MPKTSEEIIADLRAQTALLRGQTARLRGLHARLVADRHRREEVAGERHSRLSLVPPPTKGRKAPKKKAKAKTSEDIIAESVERTARLRGVHARWAADRNREEAAPERRARLTLLPDPPDDGEAA